MKDIRVDRLLNTLLEAGCWVYWRRDDLVYIYNKDSELLCTMTHHDWSKFRIRNRKDVEIMEAPRGYFIRYE